MAVMLIGIGLLVAVIGLSMPNTKMIDKSACLGESENCESYNTVQYSESEQNPMKTPTIVGGLVLFVGGIITQSHSKTFSPPTSSTEDPYVVEEMGAQEREREVIDILLYCFSGMVAAFLAFLVYFPIGKVVPGPISASVGSLFVLAGFISGVLLWYRYTN